jgi:hypothetical protein
MENEMKQVELTAEEFDAQLERMREELGDEEFNKEFYNYVITHMQDKPEMEELVKVAKCMYADDLTDLCADVALEEVTNPELSEAIDYCIETESEEALNEVLNALAFTMLIESPVLVVLYPSEGKLIPSYVTADGEVENWMPIFTDNSHIASVSGDALVRSMPLGCAMYIAQFDETVSGVVINPWTQNIRLQDYGVSSITKSVEEIRRKVANGELDLMAENE